jgi:hypothetical protein
MNLASYSVPFSKSLNRIQGTESGVIKNDHSRIDTLK